MTKNLFVQGLLLAIASPWLLIAALAAGEAGLEFDGAWVRAMPPGMAMTAGFGTLRNPGQEAIEITSFSSDEFGDVSLHRTETIDGVSRMRAVPSLRLEPGESVELAPGGYHLMLMMPAGTVSAGQEVAVEMRAADGRSYRFLLPVERR
jgi:copper(I)-binding protein